MRKDIALLLAFLMAFVPVAGIATDATQKRVTTDKIYLPSPSANKLPRYWDSNAFTDNLTLYGNDIITKGPWVDVRAYGAKCDNVTDDTASLDLAYDNVAASSTRTYLFLPGWCVRSTPWAFAGTVAPFRTGPGLRGLGPDASGIRFTMNNAVGLTWGAYSVGKDFGVDGSGGDNIILVRVNSAGWSSLQDVRLSNGYKGIEFWGDGSGGGENADVSAWIDSVAYGVDFIQTSGALNWPNNNRVRAKVLNASLAALRINGGDANDIYIDAQGNAGYGVQVLDGKGNRIRGYVELNTLGNIYVSRNNDVSALDILLFGADAWATSFNTTGSVNSGQDNLVVASADYIVAGKLITIEGAGAAGADLLSHVKSVSGTTVVLDNSASTTVANASVYKTAYLSTQSLNVAGEQYHYNFGTHKFDTIVTQRQQPTRVDGSTASFVDIQAGEGTTNLITRDGSSGDYYINVNLSGGFVDLPQGVKIGTGTEIAKETWGATDSTADNTAITHGIGSAPTAVICTPSVAAEFCSVTTIGATTFTVALKKHDGSAGTSQTVYWRAFK